jgi:hypothetical protein
MHILVSLLMGLCASLLHELGHVFAASAVGFPAKRIGITWWGIYTVRPKADKLWKNQLVTLSGLIVNLIVVFVCLLHGAIDFAEANFFVLCFNIVWPMSDGWALVRAYLESRNNGSSQTTGVSQA